MSDPRSKAERSKAKDARQQKAPDRLKAPPGKKAKPVRLEHRYGEYIYSGWIARWRREWFTYGYYRTEEIAKKVAAKQMAKHPGLYEFRLNGVVL